MTQQTPILAEYFEALARLKTGRPVRVPKGTKITNDAVALEAGRGKGSIKKLRRVFAELIPAIEEAAKEQASSSPEQFLKEQIDKVKGVARQLRKDLDSALNSLVSRLYEVHELKAKVRKLEGQVALLSEHVSPTVLEKVRNLR